MSGPHCAPDTAHEQVALLRHWGGVEARVSQQMSTQMRYCQRLEAELLRLRAQWVIASTQCLWGLGWPMAERSAMPAAAHAADETGPATATDVICQTGCAAHAHPWREDDGQCRLTGQACARVPVGGQLGEEFVHHTDMQMSVGNSQSEVLPLRPCGAGARP